MAKTQRGRACPPGCTCGRHSWAKNLSPEERKLRFDPRWRERLTPEERKLKFGRSQKCLPGCTCGKHKPNRSEAWRENVRRATTQRRKGSRASSETRAKLSASIRQAYKDNPSYRYEVGKAQRGKVGTFKNHRVTEETKEKIRRSQAITYSKQGYLRTSVQQNTLFGLLHRVFPEALLNHQVEVSPNRYRYIDVALPSLRLAVEYDGGHWHQDPEREARRDLELRNNGWVVLHVDYSRLQQLVPLNTAGAIKQKLLEFGNNKGGVE